LKDGETMEKEKSISGEVLTNLARTVGTTAGIIANKASQLTEEAAKRLKLTPAPHKAAAKGKKTATKAKKPAKKRAATVKKKGGSRAKKRSSK
jgi:hypothetical protein